MSDEQIKPERGQVWENKDRPGRLCTVTGVSERDLISHVVETVEYENHHNGAGFGRQMADFLNSFTYTGKVDTSLDS